MKSVTKRDFRRASRHLDRCPGALNREMERTRSAGARENEGELIRKWVKNSNRCCLDMLHAFQQRERIRIQTLPNSAAAYTGPHFRYEEESLYPARVEIFAQKYTDELYRALDRAIGAAKRLIVLAGKNELGDEDVTEATRLILGILAYLSDFEGLSIMVEKLPDEKVQGLPKTRERSPQ